MIKYGYFLEDGENEHMKNLLTNDSNIKQGINKKIYYIKAEKLIREANDNFIYFKDYEMALEQVEEALRLDPENAEALIIKGNIYFCLNEMDIALECFENALEFNPYSAEAYSLKANILDSKENPKEALKCCEKAFENLRKPEKDFLTALYDQKIAILIKLKKYKEARQAVEESYKHLGEEDSSYIDSCYRDVIEEKQKKKRIAAKRLKVVYSI